MRTGGYPDSADLMPNSLGGERLGSSERAAEHMLGRMEGRRNEQK